VRPSGQGRFDATAGYPHAYRGATVAVVGAAGFIGRWVALHLGRMGADIRALVRDVEAAERTFAAFGIHTRVLEVDLGRDGAIERTLRDLRPSVVFNLAGYGVDRAERDDRMAYRINATAIERMAHALSGLAGGDPDGPRLVHVGSALEYGTAPGDLHEDTEPAPTTTYGRSKLAGTLRLRRVCGRTGLRAVTARAFTVYGPGEHPGRLLPSLVDAAADHRPVPLTEGLQRRDFTYVEDVAEGLLRLGAADMRPGEAVNLATGALTSVRRFIETAAEVLAIPPANLQFGALPTRPEEMKHDPVAVGRLRELTGWAPATPPADGIRRTVAFGRGERTAP
jgi:nucleoside-diphosphate-sugar epimerase